MGWWRQMHPVARVLMAGIGDATLQQSLRALLDEEGMEVVACATVDEFAEGPLPSSRCDVAVIEVDQGRISDDRLLNSLAEIGASTPLVVLAPRRLITSAQRTLGLNVFALIDRRTASRRIAAKVRQAALARMRRYVEDSRDAVTSQQQQEGRPVRMLECHVNVTEWKCAQERLQRSEEWFRSLIELSASVYAVIDAHGTVLYESPSVERWYGWTPGELVGRNATNLIHPEDVDRALTALSEIVACPGAVACEEFRYQHKNGSWRWVRAIGVNHIENPAVGGIVLTSQDITECKEAEESRARSESFLRSALNALSSHIAILDESGRIIAANAAWHEFARTNGADPTRVSEGVSYLEVCDGAVGDHSDEARPVAAAIREVLRGGRAEFSLEYPCHDTANQRWFVVRVTRFTDGGSPRVAVAHETITERKQAEIQLAVAKDAAETANRAKSAFLANMSHEIRTPMTAILGFTEMLLSEDHAPDVQVEFLSTIHRNAESLLTIINDILDLSKIEAEKLEVELMDCSPKGIVDEVERLMRVKASEKRIRLEVNCEDSLPATIYTDPGKLRQILTNLVGNAIKFTDHGTVQIHARAVRAKPWSSPIQFQVVDTGIGIRPESQRDLFEPFTQADMSATRHHGGTGLGLAISKRLAELLGGRIDVYSSFGRGSTFTLTIEAGVRRNSVVASELPTSVEPTRELRMLEGRVLLAEDMPDVARLIQATVGQFGLQLDLACNGLEAYEMARASSDAGAPFDLILMDMRMPVLDGYETVRRLRREGWSGPIIALTADSMRGDRKKCISAGCDDYIPKPINQTGLLRILDRYLSRNLSGGDKSDPSPAGRVSSAEELFDGLLDATTVGRLMVDYSDTLMSKARQMEAALVDNDLELLAALAHDIKGSAAMYGYAHLSNVAQTLKEGVDAAEDTKELETPTRELVRLCREVVGGIRDRGTGSRGSTQMPE